VNGLLTAGVAHKKSAFELGVPAILEVPQGRSLKFPTWLSGQRVVSEASGCRA
jgi:hypothetical protein